MNLSLVWTLTQHGHEDVEVHANLCGLQTVCVLVCMSLWLFLLAECEVLYCEGSISSAEHRSGNQP